MVRMLRQGAVCGGLAITALAATLAAGTQNGNPLPLLGPTAGTFKSTIDLVTLNVSVTDGRDRPVPGLRQDDFQVLEDGVAQDLAFFAASEVPIDVALLVDSSSSMLDKMPTVVQAAEGFINTLRPIDRGAVMGFASQLRVVQPFTSDHDALKAAIRSIRPRGSTALYTSVYVALSSFQKAKRDQGAEVTVRRPAIVVLTDGEDTSSLIRFDDLLDRARRAGVAIYPIAIAGDYDFSGLTEPGERRFASQSDFSLKSLARETGARAFFPAQVTDLNGVYHIVAEELSTQYALGYVPKAERKDGAFRHLLVRILSRPDARPRTRTGYYAAGPMRVENTR